MQAYRVLFILSSGLLACGPPNAAQQQSQSSLGAPNWSSTSTPAARPEVDSTRPDECTGANLDVSWLARSGTCSHNGYAQELPSVISASLSGQLVSVLSGQDTSVQLLLKNTSHESVELYLDSSCGFGHQVSATIRDRSGKRLDRVGRQDCNTEPTCAGEVAYVTLKPSGVATIDLPLSAKVTVVGQQCEKMPGRALSPGRYDVELATPYAANSFSFKLQVEELKRLPMARCGEYARVVAALAEPDLGLRKKVETTLKAHCEDKAPSLKFADCRMNSTTTIALEKCQEVYTP